MKTSLLALVLLVTACQSSDPTPDAGVLARSTPDLQIPNTRCGECTAHLGVGGISWSYQCCVEQTVCRIDLGCHEVWECHTLSCRPSDIDPNP